MDIENKTFSRLVRVLKEKEHEVANIKATISNGILDENRISIGDTVELTKRDDSQTIVGTLIDATIVTVDGRYHKGVIVKPENLWEKLEFSLNEYTIKSVQNSSESNFTQF